MIDPGFFIFLCSGLFLGWSQGANDAANIFGFAVTSRMLRFRTAAILFTLFVITGTWVASPILGAVFAWLIYLGLNGLINLTKPHLLWLDHWTRLGLMLAGIFGAYSLGANNIGNVMGVFVDSWPLRDIQIGELFALSGPQRLFLWGGIAIGAGVFFSRPVMTTIGKGIVPIGPLGGWL